MILLFYDIITIINYKKEVSHLIPMIVITFLFIYLTNGCFNYTSDIGVRRRPPTHVKDYTCTV